MSPPCLHMGSPLIAGVFFLPSVRPAHEELLSCLQTSRPLIAGAFFLPSLPQGSALGHIWLYSSMGSCLLLPLGYTSYLDALREV